MPWLLPLVAWRAISSVRCLHRDQWMLQPVGQRGVGKDMEGLQSGKGQTDLLNLGWDQDRSQRSGKAAWRSQGDDDLAS